MDSAAKSAGQGSLLVDVLGEQMSLASLSIAHGQRETRFFIDESIKDGVRFHIGAFFSKAVLSDAVFRYPRARRVAVLTESPIDSCYGRLDEVTRRFPVIFTHQRQLLDRGGAFRPLMFGTNWLGVEDGSMSSDAAESGPAKSEQVSFIGSLEHPDNGAYRFRRQVAEMVLKRGDVHCFGKGIRPLAGKQTAIAPYRFSIAMENAASDYYFSEKLIDCLLMETVPIYYGCPSIGELFDARGILQFGSCEELASILDSLTVDKYKAMRPYVRANKQKAIAERWHSHAGLLARLASSLVGQGAAEALQPLQRSGRWGRLARKSWERLI